MNEPSDLSISEAMILYESIMSDCKLRKREKPVYPDYLNYKRRWTVKSHYPPVRVDRNRVR